MDAFAVAICKGLALRQVRCPHMALVGLWFGGFQALMPLLGYLVGVQFADAIAAVDHWIAFALLAVIGGNMIREALSKEEDPPDASLSWKKMLPLAVATSIDALATGVTFAFMRVDLWLSIVIIGLITFGMCTAGVPLGRAVGKKLEKRAELAGGIVLILIGTKILLEHLLGGG